MHKPNAHLVGRAASAIMALALFAGSTLGDYQQQPGNDTSLRLPQTVAGAATLTIEYPFDGALFPSDIAAPTFIWKDTNPYSHAWRVIIKFQDDRQNIESVTRQTRWTPEPQVWQDMKKRSRPNQATVTILALSGDTPPKTLSKAQITFETSAHAVEAPIFFREVNLPFVDAVKDPSHIRWRFGGVSSQQQPPVVLEKLPVCGNCHSFSADADVLGMDVDYANDKGSYAIVPIEQKMVLDKSTIITWSDYNRDDKEVTFGLLSQVSPDGRYVVSTVKDESVFVPKPGLEFSQLFFPIKGILCIYDRQQRTFAALPGADDPYLVQSNPTWSPDGKYIVFAASEAYKLKRTGPRKVLLTGDECWEFLEQGKPFKFDLYRIPFNGGKGGKAEPLEGASFNGMSNFFARYSPDGKWIVFCKAENYMLLQPDSKLYIIPAEGGQARKLLANTVRMNSWHSFSPNGKWLVFSAKPNSPYTQLFLTHIDEMGRSTPPVVLDRFTAPDRAANIPEFVNIDAYAIETIREQFVDDLSYIRAAREFMKAEDYAGVERQCRKALEINPQNPDAYCHLGLALFHLGKPDEAVKHWTRTVELDPNNVEAYCNLAQAMIRSRKNDQAAAYFRKVLSIKPDHVQAQANLGALLLAEGNIEQAVTCLNEAVRLDPNNVDAHYNLAQAMFHYNRNDQAVTHLLAIVRLEPDDAEAHNLLATAFARQKKIDRALEHWLRVIEIDPNNTNARYNVGHAMAGQGKIDEAINHWSEVIRLDPANIAARYNLALALTGSEKHDQAVAHWLEFLKARPNHPVALMNIAAGYAATGRREKALAALEKARDLARSAPDPDLAAQITKRIELLAAEQPAAQ
ncbi:MAG: tetratricopeptide repeat protein [Sedimentisphaerales bacterium]|nr:tetratricopeptide repeat protein [Sedimentisphaerales bacterium]